MAASSRIKALCDKLGLSVREFERNIGASNGTIATAIRRKSGIDSIWLEKIVTKFPQVNLLWIITGEGDMFEKVAPKMAPILAPKGKKVALEERQDNYETRIITIDKEHHELIPITDINVAAGGGVYNSDYIEEEDILRLPSNMLKKGYHLCVRVKGASMSPTLHDSGYLIIRLLDRSQWLHMPTEHVYVVTDAEGKSQVKRLKNRMKQGFIVCMSDNPDKATFPNFNLESKEIMNIWYAEWYFSAKMPNIHDQYYTRLQRLEDRLDDITRKLK